MVMPMIIPTHYLPTLSQDKRVAEEASTPGDKIVPTTLADSESSSTSVADERDCTMSWAGRKSKINDEANVGGNRAGRRYAGYGEGIVLRPYTPHATPPSSSY